MSQRGYFIVNGITLYRVVAAPVLVYLIFVKNIDVFKWLLAISFFTDAIDGYLARKYKVASAAGARLDSIGDDLTVAAAVVGIFVFFPGFVKQQLPLIAAMLALYLAQLVFALIRYRKISTFHTYAAKVAAVLQGLFLISFFFLKEPLMPLFFVAAACTVFDSVEEIILVWLLPVSKSNVKGLYWVLKKRKGEK